MGPPLPNRRKDADMPILLKTCSSLEKILPNAEPKGGFSRFSACYGEKFSFQIAYTFQSHTEMRAYYTVGVASDLAEAVSLYQVELVPVKLACYPNVDDGDYLTRSPGLLPDALLPFEKGGELAAVNQEWRSLLVSVDLTRFRPEPGAHKLVFVFGDSEHGELTAVEFDLDVIGFELPKQKLINTQWFHSDCIAQYYDIPVFSEKHWELIEKYMKTAAEHGQNMILTPVFTPPLDTRVGAERPTVQLVGVEENNGEYEFDFSLLARWIETAKRAGMEYFEISHLYTQWGAKHAPKIIAQKNGKRRRIFGWETDAHGSEYKTFLRQFLAALTAYLKSAGEWENCVFHVSDEPNETSVENYKDGAALVREFVPAEKIIDALSNFDYYKDGLLKRPVAATDHAGAFIEAKVPDLWVYYCCGQGDRVSNRFIAMPGRRTRVIASQLFKYDIAGFLQWGYNFWNTHLSLKPLDPWRETDGDSVFPAGDAFSVYPGKDGPVLSLHYLHFYEALCDLRALDAAAAKIGKEAVLALIDPDGTLTFEHYPRTDEYILDVRERLNRILGEKFGSFG